MQGQERGPKDSGTNKERDETLFTQPAIRKQACAHRPGEKGSHILQGHQRARGSHPRWSAKHKTRAPVIKS